MIYFTDKDGNVIGKSSPTSEQVKKYLKDGFKECDVDGKVKKKAKKKKK